jgi:hypothetical protein
MTCKRPRTWTLSKPHKMSSTSILWQSGWFPKNWPRCRKPCAIAHENRPKRTFSGKNKIRARLARRPILVVLRLKLWSARGGGTVRVTKCVILASIWASNCLLGKATKRPVKILERGPYGPKINGKVSKKLAWVPKTVCYSSRKSPETDVFTKKLNLNPSGPETYPGGAMPLTMVGTWRRDRSSDEMCHSGFRLS